MERAKGRSIKGGKCRDVKTEGKVWLRYEKGGSECKEQREANWGDGTGKIDGRDVFLLLSRF